MVDSNPIGSTSFVWSGADTWVVVQPWNSTFLVTIEDLVAALARNPKLSAEFRHRLAGEPQTAVSRPLPNTPSTASLPPQKGKKCNLCVRYGLLPLCRAA